MTQGMHVRLRRQDQNRLMCRPADAFSHPYYFPTIDAACTFAIRSARDGWDVEMPDGSVLSRTNNNEEVAVAGKSLRGSTGTKSLRPKGKSLRPKPAVQLPALFDVPDGTDWVTNGHTHLVTKMADGTEIAWDTCGVCAGYVAICKCSMGVTAPNGVKYIAHKSVGMVGGAKWEDVPMPSKSSGDSARERTSFVHPWREGKPTTTGKRLGMYKPAPPPVVKGKSLRRVEAPAVAPVKKSLRKPSVEIRHDFDISTLDSTAEAQATNLTSQLKKSLNKYRKG